MEGIKLKRSSKFSTLLIYAFELTEIYVTNRVSRSAAALSYWLTLSLFPTLICIHAMLASFATDISLMLDGLSTFVPAGTLQYLDSYLNYLSTQDNRALFTAGLLAMATTSAAVFRTIHSIMADIQGAPRFNGVFKLLFSFVFSLLFLGAIYFAIVVMLAGNWLISILSHVLPQATALGLWTWLRYPLLFVIMVFIIYGLYRINTPKDIKNTIFPGAIMVSVVLVLVSALFSWFIGMSAKYPLVYGSLASIIIFMLWMYICAQILIMGNALNVVLRRHKVGRQIIPQDDKRES